MTATKTVRVRGHAILCWTRDIGSFPRIVCKCGWHSTGYDRDHNLRQYEKHKRDVREGGAK